MPALVLAATSILGMTVATTLSLICVGPRPGCSHKMLLFEDAQGVVIFLDDFRVGMH